MWSQRAGGWLTERGTYLNPVALKDNYYKEATPSDDFAKMVWEGSEIAQNDTADVQKVWTILWSGPFYGPVDFKEMSNTTPWKGKETVKCHLKHF